MTNLASTELYNLPDQRGHFGSYGGVFVAETLMLPISELTDAYYRYMKDKDFLAELDYDLQHYVGRPSPIYHAERLSREAGGAQIFLKREDLNHTGAHKVNNTVGQALLAKRMGKTRIIAETGAGQHGVATATVAARLGLEFQSMHGLHILADRQLPMTSLAWLLTLRAAAPVALYIRSRLGSLTFSDHLQRMGRMGD